MDSTDGETHRGGESVPPLPAPPPSSWTPRMPVAPVAPRAGASAPGLLALPARRFGGLVVDLAVLLVPTIVLVTVLIVNTPWFTAYAEVQNPTYQQSQQLVDKLYGPLVLLAIFYVAYTVLFIHLRGQTPGKMAAGVRVVQIEDGVAPSWGRALARSFIPAVAWFLPGVGILAVLLVYLWMLWDSKRQGLHDKVARTIVVRTRTT